MRESKAWAYFCIIFVNIVWGLSFIASKYALGSGFTPFTLALVRFALTGALLLPWMLATEGKPGFTRREWMRITASALLGTTLYFLFEYKGLIYTTASNASLVLSVLPVMVMLLNFLRHGKRYSLGCWLGMAVTLVGVYLVVRYGGDDDSAPNPLLGNLLLLGACACWVFYIEVSSSLLTRHGSVKLTAYQGAIGAATLVPFALTELPQLRPIGMGGIWAALFLGLCCSALCYILYAQAMRLLAPFRTALFINLNPLAAVIGGMLLLHESLSPPQLAGGVIILLGIFYTNAASRNSPDRHDFSPHT